MNSDDLKFNPLKDENKGIKPKKRLPVLKLFKDFWSYMWHENEKGEKKDTSKIDENNNKKKLKIAKRQQKLEASARKKAQFKAKKVQSRLLKQQKQEERELLQKSLVKTKEKDKKVDKDKVKSMQHLVEDKFAQSKPGNHGMIDHKFLANQNSALKAGLLRQAHAKPAKEPFKLKKKPWFSKLFASKPEKKTKIKPMPKQVVLKKEPEEHSKLTDLGKHKEKMAKRFAAEREKYANLKIRQDIENRYWHSHNIVRANLIKDQETLFFNWQSKILTLVLALGLAMLTIGILYGGLLVWESKKLNDNQYIFSNLEGVNEQVKKEEDFAEKILEFNDKLVLVDFILDNHIYWTNFFKFLEEYTIFDVYYEGFSGDTGGEYAIPAIGRDYRSVYLQIKLMQLFDKTISADTESAQALVEQISGPDEEVKTRERIKFVLDLLIDRKIFLR
ncbi:MAG: hypothetical protein ABIG10_02550 [bacterium]